jgi:hypothetical protein
MGCLILTPEIKEIAKNFPKETDESIKNLIGIWQDLKHKSMEEYPSVQVLSDFIKEIRGKQEINNNIDYYKNNELDISYNGEPKKDLQNIINSKIAILEKKVAALNKVISLMGVAKEDFKNLSLERKVGALRRKARLFNIDNNTNIRIDDNGNIISNLNSLSTLLSKLKNPQLVDSIIEEWHKEQASARQEEINKDLKLLEREDYFPNAQTEKENKYAIEKLKAEGIVPGTALIEEFLNTARSTNPYHQIFKQVIKILRNNNIPINIVFDSELNGIAARRQDSFKTATVRFNPKLLLSYLMTKDRGRAKNITMQILTHELIHAVTAEILESHPSWAKQRGFDKAQTKFNTEIWNLYKQCEEQLKDTGWYGLLNAKEFVAEALTNKQFQIELSKIKVGKETAYKKFINYITKLFNTIFKKQGINIENSALEKIISISEKYFKYANKGINKGIDDYNLEQDSYEVDNNQNKNIINQLISHLKSQGANVLGREAMEEYLKTHSLEGVQQTIAEQKEMEAIKQKAIADGTFMKAPNGKPTNLNERQWLQVRTANFKNWFGDWENNPAEASKVVDENGEPLVVYHGSSASFTTFDVSFQRPGQFEYGFYFTPNKELANRYSKNSNLYEVFLNLKTLDIAPQSRRDDWVINDGVIAKASYETTKEAREIVVRRPNQIKSATDNNGNFSTTDDDIQAAYEIDNSNINDLLTDDDKADILKEIKKINRAKRTLIDTGGNSLFLVDHTDRDGLEHLEEGQEGFLCKAKIDIVGLSREEIQTIKKEYKDGPQSKESLNRVLKSHGLESRYQDSDNIDIEDRESNLDNAGLDKQTPQGKPRGGQSAQNSSENLRTGQVKTGFDGTNGPRYVDETFTTPQGEVYGFVDKDGNIYLDETVISPEHPIHEYTHLWDRLVHDNNPELWKRGVALMKQTSLWNEILNDEHYGKLWQAKGISGEKLENLIASEVHSRLTGQQGAEILEKIAKEQGEIGIIAKLKQWILDFWRTLNKTFGNWTDEELDNLSLEDFVHLTIRDFAFGINYDPEASASDNGEEQDVNDIAVNFGTTEITVENINDVYAAKPKISKTLTRINLMYDPVTRKNRTRMLADDFSNMLTKKTDERIQQLENLLAKAQNKWMKDTIQKELDKVNRLSTLKLITPNGLFNDIRNFYIDYVNTPKEDKIQAKLEELKQAALESNRKYTEKQLLDIATKQVNYLTREYNKLTKDSEIFKQLCIESLDFIRDIEHIEINLDSYKIEETSGSLENAIEDFDKEENTKEGWQTNFREVSIKNSLSNRIKEMVQQIPKLNERGVYDTDDLDKLQYLESDMVIATLAQGLTNMITSDDLIPMLEKLAQSKYWVNQIIDKIKKDSQLFTSLYRDFRKDHNSYWIQREKIKYDGSKEITIDNISEREATSFYMKEAEANYNSRVQLDELSLYNEKGDVLKPIAKKVLDFISNVQDKYEQLKRKHDGEIDKIIDSFLQEGGRQDITRILHMIGFTADPIVVNSYIINKTPKALLENFSNIVGSIWRGQHTIKNGTNLIQEFYPAYRDIAKNLSEFTEMVYEPSISETNNGETKSYYTFTTPNYIGKLVKNLSNAYQDEERFQKFLEEEFGQYDWFYNKKEGRWLNGILEDLASFEDVRAGFKYKTVLASNKSTYDKWTKLDYTRVLLGEFFNKMENKEGYAYFPVPIMSDVKSAEFFRLRLLDGHSNRYKEEITSRFVDLVLQEYNRIQLVRQRYNARKNGDKSIEPIAYYDITEENGEITDLGGAQFIFLQRLNSKKINSKSFLVTLEDKLRNKENGSDIRDFIQDVMEEVLEEDFEQAYQEWYDMGLFKVENGNYVNLPNIAIGFKYNEKAVKEQIKRLNKVKDVLGDSWTMDMQHLLDLVTEEKPFNTKWALGVAQEIKETLDSIIENGDFTDTKKHQLQSALKNYLEPDLDLVKENLRNYFYHSSYYTSQITELLTTDLAFYGNLKNFQKRAKEWHSPTLRLNTNAEWNGEKVGKKEQRTMYLADDIIKSEVYDDIKEILNNQVASGNMTKEEAKEILKKYEEVNVADSQAYITPKAYRALKIMSEEWSEELEEAYQHIIKGEFTATDYNTMMQPVKPFMYTQVGNDSGVTGTSKIKTPVQHKNSVYLLLANNNKVSSSLSDNTKLRALQKFMEDHDIDIVQFESAVKVGKQGVIDINGLDNENDIIEKLENATGVNTEENVNVIHTLSYEDYGIQMNTPEHLIDSENLVGTQIRKLVTADLPNNFSVTISGKRFNKTELLNLYNELIIANIEDSFEELKQIFESPLRLLDVIKKQLKTNKGYTPDMLNVISIDEETGKLNWPLYDPTISTTIQQGLSSIIKKRITKQQIKGGAMIQVSKYGNKDLKIVFEEEGKNKRIKYFECYMPAYSKKFFEPLMDKDGKLDINKLPENLRTLIGYRIPTENKYSMAPLYIKGFLPQSAGAAIMLPADITTIAGSDFDVDKLYVFLPEFNYAKYDMHRAVADFIIENKDYENTSYDEIINNPEFKKYFDKYKNEFLNEKPLTKVQYDFNKSVRENGRKERNNLMIDIMNSILTHQDIASQILNPGSFDAQKKAARFINILNNNSVEELAKIIKALNLDKNKGPLEQIANLDLGTLNRIKGSQGKALNPLSPVTQVTFQQQNMLGNTLIGIYANQNVFHALLQQANIAIKYEQAITINGKHLTKLGQMYNAEHHLISKNGAGYLNASVDNVKDPVLDDINQNTFTANISSLLSNLGYEPLEVALLMSQPIIKDISTTYLQYKGKKSQASIIAETIKEYSKKGNMATGLSFEDFKTNKLLFRDLCDNIINSHRLDNISTNSKQEYYKRQVAIGYIFTQLLSVSDFMNSIMKNARFDTSNKAPGPNIADTIEKLLGFEDTQEKLNKAHYNYLQEDVDLKKAFPMNYAFYEYGIVKGLDLISNYMPHLNLLDAVDKISESAAKKLSAKTINSIFQDLMQYLVTAQRNFQDKKEFIKEFPSIFQELKNSKQELANNPFIQKIKLNHNNDIEEDSLEFYAGGKLGVLGNNAITRAWEQLLYSKDTEIRNLAIDLFKYGYYKYGGSFKIRSYMHLAPTTIKYNTPGYLAFLTGLINVNVSDYSSFTLQYLRNHLDNKELVHTVDEESAKSLRAENEKVVTDETLTEEDLDNLIGEINPNAKNQPSFVKTMLHTSCGLMPVYHDVIGVETSEGTLYYLQVGNDPFVAEYKRIKPLGVRNFSAEYDVNKDGFTMTSMFKEAMPEDHHEIAEEDENFDSEDAYENSELRKDLIKMGIIKDDFQAVAETPITDKEKEYEEYLGELKISNNKPKNIPINEEFRDENDEKLCK